MRDPRDQGLSFFKNDITDDQPFSYDLEEIGKYNLMYQGLMKHWHEMLPERFFDLQYENIVNDTDSCIDLLLNYCGLAFEPACLMFQNTQRAVKTTSRDQVRKPIYTSSVGSWKRYQHHLEPLLGALAIND